jgi:hypothetical protein
MPYAYYQFVRVAATLVFVVFSLQSFNLKSNALAAVYIVLAILFQPIEKIALGREIWNGLDVFVGLGLLFLAWKENNLSDD